MSNLVAHDRERPDSELREAGPNDARHRGERISDVEDHSLGPADLWRQRVGELAKQPLDDSAEASVQSCPPNQETGQKGQALAQRLLVLGSHRPESAPALVQRLAGREVVEDAIEVDVALLEVAP